MLPLNSNENDDFLPDTHTASPNWPLPEPAYRARKRFLFDASFFRFCA